MSTATREVTATATSLTVEVTATVKVRQKVDIVTLFQTMDERAQHRYRRIELDELGLDAEWQRPVAYLWPEEDDLIPLSMAPNAPNAVWGDIDTADVRLTQRGFDSVYGRQAEWTKADFETLTAQVPWLRTFHKALNSPLSAHEIARLPTPDDVPLF